MYAGVAKELRQVMAARDNLAGADIGNIFGLLGVARGIGNIICGPLSEILLKGTTGSYGGGYGPLVVFTGTTAVAAVGSIAFRWVMRMQET